MNLEEAMRMINTLNDELTSRKLTLGDLAHLKEGSL